MTINTEFFDKLVDRIDAVDNPIHLNTLIDQVTSSLQKQKDEIEAAVARLAPWLELASLPAANPAEIVTWLGKLVTAQVGPQIAAQAKHVADLATIGTQIGRVLTALNNAKDRLGLDVVIPAIT